MTEYDSGDPAASSPAESQSRDSFRDWDEAAVAAALRDLPLPKIPDEVAARIESAIAAAADARSKPTRQPASDPAPDKKVSKLTSSSRRWRRGRHSWALAGGGLAAAGLVGVALLTSDIGGKTWDRPTAAAVAVVALNTSDTDYSGSALGSQVNASWQSAKNSIATTMTREAAASDPPGPDLVLATPTNTPLLKPMMEASFASSATGVANCARRLAPQAKPVLVDLGSYRVDDANPAKPAAVIVFETSDPGSLEIFVVDRSCSAGIPPFAHLVIDSG